MMVMFLWMLRGTRSWARLRLRRRPGLGLRRFAARLNWRGLARQRGLARRWGLARRRGFALLWWWLARRRGFALLLLWLAQRRGFALLWWWLAQRRDLAWRIGVLQRRGALLRRSTLAAGLNRSNGAWAGL
jgi:hypothetical protein